MSYFFYFQHSHAVQSIFLDNIYSLQNSTGKFLEKHQQFHMLPLSYFYY